MGNGSTKEQRQFILKMLVEKANFYSLFKLHNGCYGVLWNDALSLSSFCESILEHDYKSAFVFIHETLKEAKIYMQEGEFDMHIQQMGGSFDIDYLEWLSNTKYLKNDPDKRDFFEDTSIKF